mmetsp:Transcript_63860/g.101207  ORF Transcript_63860/g.101207 Transcript_63860/m.101207 type:complete len:485 (-) Transcript_63860:43-1497(-)
MYTYDEEKVEGSGYPTGSSPPTVQAPIDHFSHVFTRCSKGSILDAYSFSKKPIGEGSFGRVFIGKHKQTEAQRAIKEIAKDKIKDIAKFDNEVSIQQSLDHPNIVKLYETYTDKRNVFLVMEMCTGGELFDRIIDAVDESKTGMAFDETKAAAYVQQIIGAMRYLHSKSFCHRDIKPENFLMEDKSPDAQIKIIDFGLAAEFKPGVPLKTKAGTPYYVAPQVLQGSYDEKCDVWSTGVIAYILLAGYPPFSGDNDKQILNAVKKGKVEYPSPDWDGVSKSGKELINVMLTMDPAKRPSFEMLLKHRWLTDHSDKGTAKLHSGLGSSLTKFRDSSKFKKLALTVLAQQLSDANIQELKATFKALDENNDGTLTIEEITNGIKKNHLEIDMSVLDTLDTDGSGMIDYTEFIAATLDHKKHITTAALSAAFAVFDEDGDGTISREELKRLTHSTDDPMIAAMIKEVDLDGDGQISWEEFRTAMGFSS